MDYSPRGHARWPSPGKGIVNSEISNLLKLQRVDSRLELLQRELGSRPVLVAEQDSRVIAIQERKEQTGLALKGSKLEIDKADLDLKSHEAKIEESKKKLGQASTNNEYAALNQQIARFEEEREPFEEKLLVLWDEHEQLEAALEELDKELVDAKKILDSESAEIGEEIAEIEAEIAKFEEKREEAKAPIDADMLTEYERLRKRYGANCVVSAETHVCAGCHMSISPQILNLLNDDSKVTACTNCARILYMP